MRNLPIAVLCLMVLSLVATAGGQAAKRIGMANPASVHCIKIGGKSKILTDARGNQTGYCHLPDGRVCEEWALFRDKKCRRPKG